MMFSVFCPTHDARVLMTRRNALSFWNSDDGPVIRWRCNCGHEGLLTSTACVADDTNQAQHACAAPTDEPVHAAR